jgi:hypothetical protein
MMLFMKAIKSNEHAVSKKGSYLHPWIEGFQCSPGSELLCPIDQLAQLVNLPSFFQQFVNPDYLINWAAIGQFSVDVRA